MLSAALGAAGNLGGVPRRPNPLALRLVAASVLAVMLAVAAATIAFGLDPDGDGRGARAAVAGSASACGTGTAASVAAVQSLVARRIYTGELHGSETRLDAARVRGYRPLLDAVASGDAAAVQGAVHQLVYMPHWHIVRLRVSTGGRMIADVGGPHVLAPVTGALPGPGRPRFVMSVQDDLGYVKLITRFIGAPIDLYQGGSLVMGTLPAARAELAQNATVTVAGRRYEAQRIAVRAFPGRPLEAVLFVPADGSARSCAAVRLAAWGAVARDVAARFHPLSTHLGALADVLRSVTTGSVVIRTPSHVLAGAGPARPPLAGSVSYRGRRWAVYSWQPLPDVRAFLLTPP